MSLFHHDHHEDKSDEYATPRWYVQPLADAVGGFDLDPASGAEPEPHADETYTEADDGLSQPWFGTVWLNPPFSEKADWLRKARDELERGNVDLVVGILPVDTSTGWFHEHVVEADAICFNDGRLSFDGGGSRNRNPNFGVMNVVYGDPPADLLDVLEHRGEVFLLGNRYRTTEQLQLTARV